MNKWQPSASIENLKQRANIIKKIREFFAAKNVLEVETPLLNKATVTDLHLHSLITSCSVPGFADPQTLYLQTSPEFAMKRLLAAGSGAIYQICKAFRNEEAGARHNAEFTMLEWYQPGFDHHDLMAEIDELLQLILGTKQSDRITYRDVFIKYCDIDPFTITETKLQQALIDHNIEVIGDALSKDNYLNLLITHVIEPQLGFDVPTFIYDYPVSQAMLAKIRNDKLPVTERFEVYVKGVELASGYHELCDPNEQLARFGKDIENRKAANLPIPQIDHDLIAALRAGMPECAGVALGLDRLIMLAIKAESIADVIAFPLNG